jgi:flavin-binding protein dodecin
MDNSVYKIIEVVGTSSKSWEDAAKAAVKTAGLSLRDLRIAEIIKLDMAIAGSDVIQYRARVSLSFKYVTEGKAKAKAKAKAKKK